ncbi:MAG: flavodoxin family protein, partial [Firmicutes bacterium]|nr:flavodoxin family protein [Bacillota bacterium]
PRPDSNSEVLLLGLLEGARAAGAEVEFVRLRERRLSHCLACGWCHETGDCRLDDDMRDLYTRVEASDLLVLASPVQFGTVSALAKTFVERFQCFWAAEYLLERPRISASAGKTLAALFTSARDSLRQFECASLVVETLAKVLNAAYLGYRGFPRLEGPGEARHRSDAVDRATAWGGELVAGIRR